MQETEYAIQRELWEYEVLFRKTVLGRFERVAGRKEEIQRRKERDREKLEEREEEGERQQLPLQRERKESLPLWKGRDWEWVEFVS